MDGDGSPAVAARPKRRQSFRGFCDRVLGAALACPLETKRPLMALRLRLEPTRYVPFDMRCAEVLRVDFIAIAIS